MRTAVAMLLGLPASLTLVSAAQAAKTYNDPWLEGDLQQMRVPGALDRLGGVKPLVRAIKVTKHR